MRSLTLSEITLRAAHSNFKLKQPHINPSNYNFFSITHSSSNSKLSHHNPYLLFSRFSRQWCCNKVGDAFWHLVPSVSKSCNDIEVIKPVRESITFLDDSCVSPVKINSTREYDVTSPTSCDGLIKFSLLCGFLTLQGSQHALAGTDVASGLQSIPYLGDLGDISTGFASAFLLIFFSELGDKTFFIAALLAARNSAATVFTGTFGALAVMTLISVALGRTFHYVDELLPFRLGETDLPLDDIAAVILLVYFGVSTLIDASSGDGLKQEDEQKEAELAVSDFSGNGAGILAAASTIASTFLLVFVAEWGDKSFFSTIALAAASSPLGVISGALAGHGVATLIAVLGGSLLGTFLSEKVIAYVGGVLFLVFAAVTVAEIAN